jgi:predicted N-acetyltransferase YhbS
VRKATEADGQALAEIEQRCPIVLGDTSMYFDRSNDYFAFTRLMEEATIGIAFVDDKQAAASCAAMHTIRIGGMTHPILTIAHLRVMPEYQRKGLWGAVNRAFDHSWKEMEVD